MIYRNNFFLSLLFFTSIIWGQVSTIHSTQDADPLLKTIQNRVKWGYHHGAAVSITLEMDIDYLSAGWLDQAKTMEINKHSIFEIASLTKIFTAYLAACLREEGLIDLDVPLTNYFKDVHIPSFGDKFITLRHLLTHTSGLQDPQEEYLNKISLNRNPEADYDIPTLYNFLENTSLVSEPGTKFNYSNIGYGLVGHILEKYMQQNLENLFKKYIFDPVGMQDTTFSPSKEQIRRCATGYCDNEPVPMWKINSLYGFSGLYSTSSDLSLFLKIFLERDEKKQKTKIALSLLEPYFENEDQTPTLGWFFDKAHKKPIFFAFGGSLGFSAFIGLNLEENKAISILTNHKSLDNIGLNWLCPEYSSQNILQPIELELDYLQTLCGTYKTSDDLSVEINSDLNYLIWDDKQAPPLKLYPCSKNHFFPKFLNMHTIVEFQDCQLSGKSSINVLENGKLVLTLYKTSTQDTE
ncbi:MAG: hypothetical protein K0S74_1741 [Chlamydiales bacterium]|jgi:CubicO group peptidase (beta-lactamase class C family)|nr:hypothetical protein [Chlamydiales bacterium]